MESSINSSIIKNLDIPPTKQIYSKYDEITLPSSIDLPNGYIGRDYVCFRSKIGNNDFVRKRNSCMACQVDKKTNNSVYDNTNTNIISSCVYSTEENSNDASVWTHKQCQDKCSTMEDLSV